MQSLAEKLRVVEHAMVKACREMQTTPNTTFICASPYCTASVDERRKMVRNITNSLIGDGIPADEFELTLAEFPAIPENVLILVIPDREQMTIIPLDLFPIGQHAIN